MISLQPNDDPDAGALATLASYLRAGLSVIPVEDDKRPSLLLPGRQWAAYQHQRATPQEWQRWWDRGSRGFAIIAGPVSGDLCGLDGDDMQFCHWLRSGVAEELFAQTWVVQTCCGRIHIYLRSEIAVVTQILKSGGTKVADIRGAGQGQAGPSYLVAPPTFGRCSHNPDGGRYRTLYGSPERILKVRNALALFQWFANQYNGGSTAPQASTASTASTAVAPKHAMSIVPALSEEAKQVLSRKVRSSSISRKIQRVLFQGAVAGEGDWVDAKDDNSFIDFAVCAALVRAKFSDQEIVDCFFTLRAGDYTAKNPRRAQHGLAYVLDYTLPKAKAAVEEQERAANTATGLNFEVVAVQRVPFDEMPMWHLTIKTSQRPYLILVKLRSADFESDRSFKRTVWNQVGWMPELQGAHTGAAGFQRLMSVLGEMATTDDDLPEEASEAGYLRNVLLQTIRSGSVQHGSDDPLAQSLGWISGEWVMLRSEVLTTRVKSVLRTSASEIWRAFSRLGGHSETIKVQGRTLRVWMIPVKACDFDEEA